MRWMGISVIIPILLYWQKKKIKHTLEDSLRYEFLFVCFGFLFVLFLPTMQSDSQLTKAVTQQNTGIQYCHLDL